MKAIMSNKDILEGYINADKPFEVAAHTVLGGYMEFMILERMMFEENAKEVAEQYASLWKKGDSENVKSVCVRKEGAIIYEVEINGK